MRTGLIYAFTCSHMSVNYGVVHRELRNGPCLGPQHSPVNLITVEPKFANFLKCGLCIILDTFIRSQTIVNWNSTI